jgi:ABC-type multidrug transport system permease subunit
VNPLRELILMRLRTFVREPEALFWTFGFPILLSIGLGLAFREDADPPPTPVGVERGGAGEAYVSALELSGEVRPILMDPAEAEAALRRGDVALVVAGQEGVVFRYDPARPESREARLLTDHALQRAAGAIPPLEVEDDAERLPGGRYIDWLIPGLIGLNLMSTGMWGIGFGIVTMRQKKQLKRLIATPMRKSDFLAAQILARMAFLILEVPPIILFAWLAFNVRIAGPFPVLLLLILLGTLAFAGLGLLAASRARTIEGVSGINNVMMLPMFVMSGVFFSASRFPEAMQPFIRLLPLTALNDSLRAVYNEGLGLGAVVSEIAVLGAWTAAAFALALYLYRWQ